MTETCTCFIHGTELDATDGTVAPCLKCIEDAREAGYADGMADAKLAAERAIVRAHSPGVDA